MKQISQIEIPFNKKRLLPALIFYAVCLGLGMLFVTNPSLIASDPPTHRNNPSVIFFGGLITVVLTTPCIISILRTLLVKKVGLYINQQGITKDYGNNATFVPWAAIQEIKEVMVKKEKWLAIIVKDPQNYIDRAFNSSQKDELRMSFQACGSPVGFAEGTLKIDFEDLHQLLVEKIREYKQQ